MQINEKIETARVTGAAVLITVYGYTLEQWVAILTILYLLLQTVALAPRAIENIRLLIVKMKQWVQNVGKK